MRRIKYLLVLLCLAVMNVVAAPGYTVTSFIVEPMQGTVVVAAFDEWMASEAGKKYKGRLYLQDHTQDGANPSTHSIVAVYSSMADADAFATYVGEDEDALAAWMKLVGKVSAVSTQTFRGRFANLATWGTVSDKDRIWMQHSITTADARSTYRAIDAWMNSETGKQFPGQLSLVRTVAAGTGAGSHTVIMGFESLTEMEQWNQMSAGAASFGNLMHTFSVINEYHGASLATDVKAWGKSLKSVLK
jgi:hypothetical protein